MVRSSLAQPTSAARLDESGVLALSGVTAAHDARLKDATRLAALRATGLLDSEPEPAFDRLTRLASRGLRTPVALLSLVDERRHFFKSALGLEEPWASARQAPLSHSFCQYVVGSGEPLVVPDARAHGWLSHSPAIRELGIVAYAGVPLLTPERQALGALCVIDSSPRQWSEEELSLLRELAELAQTELTLRESTRALEQTRAEREAARGALARSEAALQTLLDNLPSGAALLFDRELRCQMAGGHRLLSSVGFSTRALAGKALTDVAPAAQLPALEARYRQVLAGQRVDHDFARDRRAYAVSLVPVREPATEEVTGGLMLTYDVTEQHRAQLSLRTEAARVELLQALARATNEARSANEAFQTCLDAICQLTRWPLGHVYVEKEGELVSSGCWHDADPKRFAPLREQSTQLRFHRRSGDFIGRAAASRRTEWLAELSDPERFRRAAAARATDLRSALACPVLIGKEVVAVIELFSESSAAPEPRWLELLSSAGSLLGRAVERDRARRALTQYSERARQLSIRDELTGLSNRRGFLELATQHLRLAERSEEPAVLFFLDLDGMKHLNDQHGQEEGDRALIDTADVLRSALRSSDIIARFGSDQFVALLPDATLEQAQPLRERIQSELAARNTRGQRRYRLAASIGSASFDPDTRESIEQLLARAEAALHEEKRRRKAVGSGRGVEMA